MYLYLSGTHIEIGLFLEPYSTLVNDFFSISLHNIWFACGYKNTISRILWGNVVVSDGIIHF